MFPKLENSPLQPVELVVEDYRHHSDVATLSTRREYHSLNTGKNMVVVAINT